MSSSGAGCGASGARRVVNHRAEQKQCEALLLAKIEARRRAAADRCTPQVPPADRRRGHAPHQEYSGSGRRQPVRPRCQPVGRAVGCIAARPCGLLENIRHRRSRVFGRAILYSNLAEQRHDIIRKRVALAGEESVSGVTRRQRPRGQPGEPSHAHLHYRQ